jgi:hypothetical protein
MPADMAVANADRSSLLTCWWTKVRAWNELHATCACRHSRPWFHHPNNTRWSLLLRNFLGSFLDSNVSLSHFIFKCAFNLCSFKVEGQVSQLYKTI